MEKASAPAAGQGEGMIYLVHVEGPFVDPSAPRAAAAPRDFSNSYRLAALFPAAAETAARQLLVAELARAGLRPAGPLSASAAPDRASPGPVATAGTPA
jgi:hypothetical protein